MSVIVSPWGPKPQFEGSDGLPLVGGQLFFYVGGSVNTKQNSYTTSTGLVANTNPVVLNSLGNPTTELWFTAGIQYKVVLAPANDTDPPSSPIWSVDHVTGVSDATGIFDQWVVSGFAPTFVSTTSFTLPGDQTGTFQVGRRIKTINSGGTIYSLILTSVFGAVTTVTVQNDSGVLDSGLSSVSYGLISSMSTSMPAGFWIAPAFSAGDYTASGAMTWTVAAPDVLTYAYSIYGKTMVVTFVLNTTTVGGVPDTSLMIAIPIGKIGARQVNCPVTIYDNSATIVTPGFAIVGNGSTTIVIQKADNSNFTASANLTYIYGQILFEIR